MTTSYVKKLCYEMQAAEDECDNIISSSNYIIISLVIEGRDISKEDIDTLTTSLLKHKKFKKPPHLVYIYKNQVLLVINKRESGSHYCNGKSQKIVSSYSSYLTSILSLSSRNEEIFFVTGSCVNFTSKIKAYSYLCVKMFDNIRQSIIDFSEGLIKVEKGIHLTLSESISKIKENSGRDWGELSNSEKYGTFYQLGENKNVKSFSQLLNFEESSILIHKLFG